VTPETLRGRRTHEAARTAAWLAKQVELGLADADLSLPQYRILAFLAEGSAISKAMADRLAVRPPSVTAVVDGLVGRGLIERHPGEGDRRSVSHGITEKGLAALAAADQLVEARLRGIARCLEGGGREEEAMEGLALWAEALVAYRDAKAVRT